jgi:putative phosphoribosyl transferase
MMFANRAEAGRLLASRLTHLRGRDVVVLGLPRGGVPVAFEVARELSAPLDVIVVRKLGVPFQPELTLGAVGEDGVRVLDADMLRAAAIDEDELAGIERAARVELGRQVRRLRGGRARVALAGRTVVIVDDGIATGATAQAACRVAVAQGAAGIVLATAVAAEETVAALRGVADDIVCVHTPQHLLSIGSWYGDFGPTSDDEAAALLERAATVATGADAAVYAYDEELVVPAGPARLAARLTVPESARMLVVLANVSGGGHSSRKRYIAGRLREAGLGTLVVDLLTPAEEPDRRNVFDIPLLARRLVDTIHWVRRLPGISELSVGLFGAGTGAAAALWAASERGTNVAAIVSRSGRPDLASDRLGEVRAPTLFIVDARETAVLERTRAARATLHCPTQLVVMPSAAHLFEEPGSPREIADLARDWFCRHAAAPAVPSNLAPSAA